MCKRVTYVSTSKCVQKLSYYVLQQIEKHDGKNVKHVSFFTLFGYGVKITPDINPKYGILNSPCPNDSKNRQS